MKRNPSLVLSAVSKEWLEGNNNSWISKVLQLLRGDFGQEYSGAKLRYMMTFSISVWSCMKAFFWPILLPLLAVSTTFIPLDDPRQGFQGRNCNLLLMVVCASVLVVPLLEIRLKNMIPSTGVDKKKRRWCALVLMIVALMVHVVCWTWIVFPFPFRTYNQNTLVTFSHSEYL